MNKKTILGCVLIVLIESLTPFVCTHAADIPESKIGRDKMVTLRTCLSDLGKKHDIYFTIEEAYEAGTIQNPVSDKRISCNFEKSTRNEVLLDLEQVLPDVKILKSKANPVVFHLIDSRLEALSNYPLIYVLASINYSGPLMNIIDEIAKQVPGIEQQTMFEVGRGPIIMDRITKVTVTATNISVRDVLTDYIPLSTYSKVLWIANTKLSDKPATTVQFGGQASPYQRSKEDKKKS